MGRGRQNLGIGDGLNLNDRGIGGTGSGGLGIQGGYGGSGFSGKGGIPRGIGVDGLSGGDGTSEKKLHSVHFMGLDYRSSYDMFYVVKTS